MFENVIYTIEVFECFILDSWWC